MEEASVSDFIFPVMQAMFEANGPVARKIYIARAAQIMRLTNEQMEQRVPSGRHLQYRHRASWATNVLKHAGFVFSPERGIWQLTEDGVAFVKQHRDGIDESAIREVRRRARRGMGKGPTIGNGTGEPEPSPLSPEEQIDAAVLQLRDAVATELLENLGNVDPTAFEQIVLDVLQKMGYGADRTDLRRVGGSGDGGIDGIIHIDRLGLEKVYVQAKRWKGNVGRPEIQGFFGALSGLRANKGVFITTSDYTREAVEFAASVSDGLVLVNGSQLAHLMIDFQVGVTLEARYVPRFDSDYFDSE